MNAIVKHSEERLMKVLLAPVISEKATFVAEKNEHSSSWSPRMLPSWKSRPPSNCCSRWKWNRCKSPTVRASRSARATVWAAATTPAVLSSA